MCMCGADDCKECYPQQQYTPYVCEECGMYRDHELVEGEWNCVNFCAAKMRADYLYDQEKDRRAEENE